MQNNVESALRQFFERAKLAKLLLPIEKDSEWQSPCIADQEKIDGLVNWAPIKQEPKRSFSDLEHALDIQIHPDFCEYFSAYWGMGWRAEAQQGVCELLQVWNDEDFDRLQENLIGHVMMKRRLKQPITLFFALTDDENFILSIDNGSGAVVLEPVGKEAKSEVAPNLATFLDSLVPIAQIE